jgi:uncharacterized protein (DUF1810 family)
MTMTPDSPDSTDSHDPFDLDRFLRAQSGAYDQALSEIKNGRKRSHWMWYVFPQMAGLGYSYTSQQYGIKSRDEALAYLFHPVLGARLRECFEAVNAVQDRSASHIFGDPDDLKLRSCATLFAAVSDSPSVFDQLLEQYFEGERDERTLALLEKPKKPNESGG